MNQDFIARIHDPAGVLSRFLTELKTRAAKPDNRRGCFALALGCTETSDVPGISAAGATAHLRRMTPAVDAEALVLGHTVSGARIPVSPAGIASPVVLTRAALSFLNSDTVVVDCGSFVPPGIDCVTSGTRVAKCLSSGRALELSYVKRLFRRGVELGERLSKQYEYLVVGECVPGGTTTALAVLKGLGYQADGLLSSSLPEANHDLRGRLVNEGLERSGFYRGGVRWQSALKISSMQVVAACGDPMQPVVAGLALAASSAIPVVLAGGSQMLAVWALISDIARRDGVNLKACSIGIVTTKWVAFDRSAAIKRLAELVDAPFAAACPDFRLSRHAGLRAYEDGHVKEGVGAGGAMATAHLSGVSPESLLHAVDAAYEQLVLGQ